MSRAGKIKYLSPTEIIATITRSAYPTLVTEGDDDVIVWRRLEEKFAQVSLTLIPAGGRDAVLEVYRQWNESRHKSVVLFLADLDTWVLSQIPYCYVSKDLIFTKGYSIENDMFMDGDLEKLLVGPERTAFTDESSRVVHWYALAARRFLRGENERLDVHPSELLDDPNRHAALTTLKPGEVYPEELRVHMHNNVSRLLRGKTLFSLLMRQIKGHSHRSLLNFGASREGPCYKRIQIEIENCLKSHSSVVK